MRDKESGKSFSFYENFLLSFQWRGKKELSDVFAYKPQTPHVEYMKVSRLVWMAW